MDLYLLFISIVEGFVLLYMLFNLVCDVLLAIS